MNLPLRPVPHTFSSQLHIRDRMGILFAGILCAMMLTGCSAFKESRKMDLGPFADNTSTMFADAQKISRPLTWIYLKPYQHSPEVADFRQKAVPVLRALRSILMYSNQLVALSSANFSESDKNKRLASYLQEVTKSAVSTGKIVEIGLQPSDLDTVLANIRKSETFLSGIGAASPLVNAYVVSMDQNLADLQEALAVALRSIDEKIEAENVGTRENVVNLTRLQNQFLREATLLYDYNLGNRSALDSLFAADASMKRIASSAERKSLDVAKEIERELGSRAAQVRSLREQLEPDVELYRAKQKELEEMRVAVEARIKLARGAMTIWAQSHRNLGDGIPVPPLIDITGTVGGLIGGAAKTVVP